MCRNPPSGSRQWQLTVTCKNDSIVQLNSKWQHIDVPGQGLCSWRQCIMYNCASMNNVSAPLCLKSSNIDVLHRVQS